MRFMKICLILIFFVSNLASSNPVVIVNKGSTIENISENDIRKVFLGKSTGLPGQSIVLLIDVGKDSEIRKVFLKKVLKKNERQLRKYWSRLVFTGKASPPKSTKTDEEVLKIVEANSDSIGVVKKSSIKNSNVKVALELN